MSGKIIDVSDCLNYNGDKAAYDPNMQVYRNELYCVWEEFTNSIPQIKIKKYNGDRWIDVSNNLNLNSGEFAYSPILHVYNDKLYCIWRENERSNNIIRIKGYNGSNWTMIASNLNYETNETVWSPTMQVYKNHLCCAWSEYEGSSYQIKMKKYNLQVWYYTSSNLNYNRNKAAHNVNMQVYKNDLYCVWNEKNINDSNYQIKIKKYNGSTWTNISSNLNYNEGMNAEKPKLQVYNNELYCAWSESNGSIYQIKIKKYNGSSWSEVSNNLNFNENQNAYTPTMQVYEDELYCAWSEAYQIKIKKYNGAIWSNVTDNMNYNRVKMAKYPNFQIYKNELYCAWSEDNANASNSQIKMKKYILVMKKHLIKHDDKYFKINDNGEIIEVENSDFKINGFDNINLITRELLESKFGNLKNIQILMWTDDIEKNEATMTCELRNSYRPIDILKKNNNGICNILFKEL